MVHDHVPSVVGGKRRKASGQRCFVAVFKIGQIIAIAVFQQALRTFRIPKPQSRGGDIAIHGHRNHGAAGSQQFSPTFENEWLVFRLEHGEEFVGDDQIEWSFGDRAGNQILRSKS